MERFQFSILMKVESWERHHYDIEAQTIDEARAIAKEAFDLSRGTELLGYAEFIESETDWCTSPESVGPYYLYSTDDNGEHLLAEIDDDSDTISIMITEGEDNG